MSDKQIRLTIRTNDARAMEFDRLLLCKAMHNEKFVKWVIQWHHWSKIAKVLPVQEEFCPAKLLINQQSFVREIAKDRRLKVKLKDTFIVVETPNRSRIKSNWLSCLLEPVSATNAN